MDKETKLYGDFDRGLSYEGPLEDFRRPSTWRSIPVVPESLLYEDLDKEIEHMLIIQLHESNTIGEVRLLKEKILGMILDIHAKGMGRSK